MQEVTNDVIRSLAAANGLTIPDERLELVRRQYLEYLKTLAELQSLPLTREAEPVPLTPVTPPVSPRRQG